MRNDCESMSSKINTLIKLIEQNNNSSVPADVRQLRENYNARPHIRSTNNACK